MKLLMDVYNCEEDTPHCFAVEKDDVPKCCPVCEGELFEYSHTVEAIYIEPVKGE
jgi:hypothetical protein